MLYAIVAIIALIIDQAVKYWTTTHIVLSTGTQKLIPGFISLMNYHNEGAAFSMLSGARWLFIALCIIFTVLVIYALAVDIIKGKCARWSAVIVLAGAVGNCIDRILNGYVVDMFVFEFVDFAVFNVADIYITCGAIVFCICILLDKNELTFKKKAAASAAAQANPEQTVSEVSDSGKKTSSKKFEFNLKKLLSKNEFDDEEDFTPRSHATPVAEKKASEPAKENPFAEWEKREVELRQAQQVEKPASPVQNAAPSFDAPVQSGISAPVVNAAPKAVSAASEMDFDLDDILAEFKD